MTDKTIFSESHKKAISAARMGQKHSEKTKAAISKKIKEAWAKRKVIRQKTHNAQTGVEGVEKK